MTRGATEATVPPLLFELKVAVPAEAASMQVDTAAGQVTDASAVPAT